jgi:acyl carrier protein
MDAVTPRREALPDLDTLKHRLKELLIERLKFEDMTPDDIGDDDPLFDGGLGLDSIDALEIVVMLESEFGLKIKNESSAREHFRSIGSLAQFVKERTAAKDEA